ncbi:MAG: GNAT family N-acetyltransferase [Saprospiraceae bacterium]|nr:GNAT family N-acetyltransferase [Saprospiraceae bacterium]
MGDREQKSTQAIRRTSGEDPDFSSLVPMLNAELEVFDGEDHAFYQQYNGSEGLNHVVVIYMNNSPIACGALKKLDAATAEIKRMFVLPDHRRTGKSRQILEELERWAVELGFKRCILETGKIQTAAVGLYQSAGYHEIPNYGPYVGMSKSVCFAKEI